MTGRIKKNTHKSFNFPKLFFFAKVIRVDVAITPSMVYEPLPEGGTNQINKIVGYGHKERIGWVGDFYEDGVEIGVYIGSKSKGAGNFDFHSLGKVVPGDSLQLEFDVEGWDQFITYQNFPYFGGKCKAPQEILLEYKIQVIERGIPDKLKNLFKWLQKR